MSLPIFEPFTNCINSIVIKAHAIYKSMMADKPVKPRFWIARLRYGRGRPHFDKSKSQRLPSPKSFGIFVESGT